MADLSDGAAVEIPFSDPDPIDDTKVRMGRKIQSSDVYRGITDAEARDRMLDVSKELDEDLEEASSSGINNGSEDDHRTSIHDDEALTDSNTKHDHSETVLFNQNKVLKKPDKILPRPRCNSLNTMFCYYNNYNVNQPRHFCKNCQRYWTAGGTMRNVPVGAGWRKTKNSLQQQSYSGSVSAPMKPLIENEVIMIFGPETPLCKSMASVLNLEGKKRNPGTAFVSGGENGKEPPCSSSVTRSCDENDLLFVSPDCAENDISKLEDNKERTNSPGCCTGSQPMHPFQGFPGPPWPYSWGPAWNNVAATTASYYSSDNSIPNPVLWGPPVILAAPALCACPVPLPVMSASFWVCMSSWPNQAWSVPWRGSINGLSQPLSPITHNVSSGNDSPSLGKHSRDGSFQGEEKIEKKLLWVPKTLRIDDPEEAAKIWSTLGIRPDESIKRGSLFRGFQSNNESNGYASNAAQVLHSNPAALARSQTFQESAQVQPIS